MYVVNGRPGRSVPCESQEPFCPVLFHFPCKPREIVITPLKRRAVAITNAVLKCKLLMVRSDYLSLWEMVKAMGPKHLPLGKA